MTRPTRSARTPGARPGKGRDTARREAATTILKNAEIARRLQERHGPFQPVLAHSFGVTCALLALREGLSAGRLVAVSGVSHFGFLVEEFGRRLGLAPRLRDRLRTRVEKELFPEVDDLWSRFDARHPPGGTGIPTLLLNTRAADARTDEGSGAAPA